MEEMELREFINITNDEANEIAYWLVKIGIDENVKLTGLAKEMEKHVKSNEGMKFLYFLLGKIETFERMLDLMDIYHEMDAEAIIKGEFDRFMKMLAYSYKEVVENARKKGN